MGIITYVGKLINTIGELPSAGTKAPDFALTKTDLSELTLNDCMGKKVILSIFPSLDTPTCALAMVRFNRIAELVDNVMVVCVSADLPFAQQRFCAAKQVKTVIPVSTFRHSEFGEKYGVTMIDGPFQGLLSRAVVLLDEKGKVLYTEQVVELTHEPNYDAVLAALRKAPTAK